MAADSYALLLYNPIKANKGFLRDITKEAKGWTRTIRMQGGFWTGSFEVTGKSEDLLDWFFNRLGYHIEERSSGGITWEGLIYEMELTIGTVRRRISLESMANYIRARYVDESLVLQTYKQDALSIARFGRKEELLQAADLSPVGQVNTLLSDRAWPRPLAISSGREEVGSKLSVSVCGYAFCANWRYIDHNNYYELAYVSIQHMMQDIISNYMSEFFSYIVDDSDVDVYHWIGSDVRAWDFLQSLTAMGDNNGDRWRMYVSTGNIMHYCKIIKEPMLFLRHDGIYSASGARKSMDARQVVPCIARDLQYPMNRTVTGRWLADERDFMVDEVSVDADGNLGLRTTEYTESDRLAGIEDRRAQEAAAWEEFLKKAWEEDRKRREKEWADALAAAQAAINAANGVGG